MINQGGFAATPSWQASATRRDCEPHRSALVLLVALFAFILAVISTLGGCAFVVFLWKVDGRTLPMPSGLDAMLLAVALSLPPTVVGSAAWLLAQRDLVGMANGRIDLSGQRNVRAYRRLATASLFLGVVGGGLTPLLGFVCHSGIGYVVAN
jgi:hypothetical protein